MRCIGSAFAMYDEKNRIFSLRKLKLFDIPKNCPKPQNFFDNMSICFQFCQQKVSLAMLLCWFGIIQCDPPADFPKDKTVFYQHKDELTWMCTMSDATGKKHTQKRSIWQTFKTNELNHVNLSKLLQFFILFTKHKQVTTFKSIYNDDNIKIDASTCSKYFYTCASVCKIIMLQVGKLGKGHVSPTEFDAKLIRGKKM